MFSQAVKKEKVDLLETSGHNDLSHAITLDSPVPYRISAVIEYLNTKNTDVGTGSSGRSKQGDFMASCPALSNGWKQKYQISA